MELPVLNEGFVERADAARNRRRILAAAALLFERDGVCTTSMDAIAAEAGVGKGTLFRRFGDRASLAMAVLDQTERDIQDAVLFGAPPLGPGAPPIERLIAFGDALFDLLEQYVDLASAAEVGGYLQSPVYAARWIHIRMLVSQARPDLRNPEYLTDALMVALNAPLFSHQRRVREMDLDQLKAGFAELVSELLS